MGPEHPTVAYKLFWAKGMSCWNLFFNVFKKIFLIFVLVFRERAQAGEGHREKETQNPKQTPGSILSAQNLTRGLNPQTPKSWPEVRCSTESPRCPNVCLFLRKIEYEWGRGRERGRQRFWTGLCADSREPDSRLELAARSWPELKLDV